MSIGTFLYVCSLEEFLQGRLGVLLELLGLLGVLEQHFRDRRDGLQGSDGSPSLCLFDSVEDRGEGIFQRHVFSGSALIVSVGVGEVHAVDKVAHGLHEIFAGEVAVLGQHLAGDGDDLVDGGEAVGAHVFVEGQLVLDQAFVVFFHCGCEEGEEWIRAVLFDDSCHHVGI